MMQIRAWQVRPGDVVIGTLFDPDAWRHVRARPHVADVPEVITRNRLRFIAPVLEYEIREGPFAGGYGTASGYGPMDRVTIRDREAA